MKMNKRLLSLILVVVMVLGMIPLSAIATDDTAPDAVTHIDGCSGECVNTEGICECTCHVPVDEDPVDNCENCEDPACTGCTPDIAPLTLDDEEDEPLCGQCNATLTAENAIKHETTCPTVQYVPTCTGKVPCPVENCENEHCTGEAATCPITDCECKQPKTDPILDDEDTDPLCDQCEATKEGEKIVHADGCPNKPLCDKCEATKAEDGETIVHGETCPTLCKCEAVIEGYHSNVDCPFYVEPTEPSTEAATEPKEIVLVESEIEAEVDGVTIKVSGKLPEGAVLEAKFPENEVFEDEKFIKTVSEMIPERDCFSYVNFYDISILVNGEKWQPGENAVTITFENMDLSNGEEVEVYHILDDEAAILDALVDETAQKISLEETPMLFKALKKAFTSEPTIDLEKEAYYTVDSSADGGVEIEGNSITFETKSFSIFVVEGYTGTEVNATLPENNVDTPYLLYRGETKYFLFAGYSSRWTGTWTLVDPSDAQYLNYEVYKNTHEFPYADGGSNLCNLFLKITALKPTPAAHKICLKFEFNNGKKDPTKPDSGYLEDVLFYITISDDTSEMYIEDNIATTGCITAKFKTEPANTDEIQYVWTRDGESVDTKAVDGATVNVAVDRGGIDKEDIEKSNPMKKYTVKAMRGEVEIGTAFFEVPYGNEILNGSFESPKDLNNLESGRGNSYYANGTTGLYWKTTGLGIDSQHGGELTGQDIEIVRTTKDVTDKIAAYLKNTYGIVTLADDYTFNRIEDGKIYIDSKQEEGKYWVYDDDTGVPESLIKPDIRFPDGMHCAEINAEAPGALYQDVLTNPGSEMYWSLAHRARNSRVSDHGWYNKDGLLVSITNKDGGVETFDDQKDYMYVIIAPTEQAKDITMQSQLNVLIEYARQNHSLDTVKAVSTTYPAGTSYNWYNNLTGRTESVSLDHDVTYSIWEVADDHTAWGEHSVNMYSALDHYDVADDQYLTRFFFAAGETAKDRDLRLKGENKTYANGNFVDKIHFSEDMPYTIKYYLDGELQSEYSEAGMEAVGSTIYASHTDKFADKYLLQTKVNSKDNSGKTYLEDFRTGKNVLELYYVSYGIKVTKTVEIEDFDKLTDAEKEEVKNLFEGYTATFELRDGSGSKITETTVTLNPENLTGTAEFLKNGRSINPMGETYNIVETTISNVNDVDLIKKAEPVNKVVADDEFFIVIEAVNEYFARSSLTIKKEYSGTFADENQSFLFHVVGKNGTLTEGIDLTVRTGANNSVTIGNLPLGEYTVTELQDWSWRYKLYSVTDEDDTAEEVDDGAKIQVDVDGNTVTFTNIREKTTWLDGDCYAENAWSGSGITATGNVITNSGS